MKLHKKILILLFGPIKIQSSLCEKIYFKPFSRGEGWKTQFKLINQERSIN